MLPHESRKYLWDIAEAAGYIAQCTAEKTYEAHHAARDRVR